MPALKAQKHSNNDTIKREMYQFIISTTLSFLPHATLRWENNHANF